MLGNPNQSGPARIWTTIFSVRLIIGAMLVIVLAPVSIDDDFRIFFARWWFDHPSFTPSQYWVPGYFYIYGAILGLTDDAVIAPRILTMGLHLALGAVFLLDRTCPRAAKPLAIIWVLFSPLSWVLGTVPLSESLFILLAVSGAVCLGRFLSTGHLPTLLCAALLYLGASMVRYEGWLLLVVYSALCVSGRPSAVKRPLCYALAAVPWVFPLVWSLWLWGMTGNPFNYLENIKTDSFGPGRLADGLSHPLSWTIPFQLGVVVGFGALITALKVISRRSRLVDYLWEVHLAAALAWLVWVLVSDNIPSQFPLRLLYPALIFGALPFASLVLSRLTPAAMPRVSLLLGGVIGLCGLAYALTAEPGYHEPSYRAASYTRALVEKGSLRGEDRVLVEKHLPQSTALVIYTNRPGMMHINNMGSDCPTDLFGCVVGQRPSWTEQVKLAVIWRDSKTGYLTALGWRAIAQTETWTLFWRSAGARPLGSCVDEDRPRLGIADGHATNNRMSRTNAAQ